MKITITHNLLRAPEQTTIEIVCNAGQNYKAENDRALLEWLFKQMNRTSDMEDLISIACILVPSLSTGDVVDIDGRKWVCEYVGWKQL